MNEALLVSNLVLWIVVVALACVVAALVRQVGVLYERVAPAGALVLPQSLQVGGAAPVIEVEALGGGARTIGAPHPARRSTLVFFLSPSCPVCKQLLPALRGVARAEASDLTVAPRVSSSFSTSRRASSSSSTTSTRIPVRSGPSSSPTALSACE